MVEAALGHVHADDFAEAWIAQEPPDECAVAAAQVEDARDAPVVQGGQHRLHTLVLESDRRFKGHLFVTALRVRRVRSPSSSSASWASAASARSRWCFRYRRAMSSARGVPGEPPVPVPEEFGHLILTDPVMLLVVQHGDQHRQMAQQVAQAHGAGKGDGEILAVAPSGHTLVQGVPFRLTW